MTRRKDSAKAGDLKEVLAGQEDFLRGLIQQVVQQVLETEMEEALGAGKGSGARAVWGTGPGTTGGR